MLYAVFRFEQNHECASFFLFSLARIKVQGIRIKALSFDNPDCDNTLRNEGTMTWKDAGSQNDHWPILLTLKSLDEEVTVCILKATVFSVSLLQPFIFALTGGVGKHCFLWEVLWCYFWKPHPKSAFLAMISSCPMILWNVQYLFCVTSFLANQYNHVLKLAGDIASKLET